MLIDIHVHACCARNPALTRPNGTYYPTPETLIRMLDDHGIDKALLMGTAHPECRYTAVPTEEVLEIAGQYPERIIPCCSIDPRWLTNSPTADFRNILNTYREMGCRAVGEYIPNIPFDDPLNLNFFKQVEEAGLPLTFHVGPTIGGCYGCYDEPGLPRLEKVLQHFPDLIFLGHSQPFWAEISTNVVDEAGKRISYPSGPVTPGRLLTLFRQYPNLYGDLSAGSGFNAIHRDPEFGLAFLEEFQDRLCFGTDIANVPQKLDIVPYFEKLKRERLISTDAYEKITWKNANRVLRLGLAEQQEGGKR
jgi:predicted TIM-barrel fold metal-dependent hydrolase